MNIQRIPKVILTFDDGRGDNYRVVKDMMLHYGLSATFNITSNYIDGTIPENLSPCSNASLDTSQVIEMSSYPGLEIAGHGANHENTKEDWFAGISKLKLWLGDNYPQDRIGVASPSCNIEEQQIEDNKTALKLAGIKYVRIGLPDKASFVTRALCKLSLFTPSCTLFYHYAKGSIQNLGDSYIVYSVPVLFKHSVSQVKYLVDKCLEDHNDCVLMFHSILKKGEPYYNDMWSWDYDKFEELCKYLDDLEKAGKAKTDKLINCFDK